jgi:hypothetical protein
MKKTGMITSWFLLTFVAFLVLWISQMGRFPSGMFVSTSHAFSGKKNEKKVAPAKKAKSQKKIKTKGKVSQKSRATFDQSKVVDQVAKNQARRMRLIDRFKKRGVIGEADNGMIKIRQSQGLSAEEKQKLMSLVKAENNDREKMFKVMEQQAAYNQEDKQYMRRKYFEHNRVSDPDGSYFFQADHWHKK